jgi:hypothetical protein
MLHMGGKKNHGKKGRARAECSTAFTTDVSAEGLGKPLMELNTDFAAGATQYGNGIFTGEHSIASMLWELSVCLCRCNAVRILRLLLTYRESILPIC